MDARTALKTQYHAALATLRQAIERCPDELWVATDRTSPYWQVAYHAVFYAHLYMMQTEGAFTPWRHHRENVQFLGELPSPPHEKNDPGEPYTKQEVLAYWRECDEMVDAVVDALDLQADHAGFWWYDMSKMEHEFMNVRHIQHHAAQLGQRLQAATGEDLDWIGSV